MLLIINLVGVFNLKWYLPVGCASGASGKVLVADADRDSCYEIYISDFQFFDKINVCELHLPNTWEMDSFANMPGEIAWDVGDFDCDGLWDLLCWGEDAIGTTVLLFITESPDSYSYPVNEVWRDTVGPPALDIGDEAFDIDQDGYPELVKNRPDPYDLGIYECTGDNHYDLIFVDTTSHGAPLGTHAFGDFDQDGHNEVVFAGANRTYWIYESPSNNTYERLRFDTLPSSGIRDCIDIDDMDQDGKEEFLLKGSRTLAATIDAFVFEATGNNMYDTIWVAHFPGGDYYNGHSDAGDVDGDSVPEIVLEARQNVFIIKAAGNDSFYVWDTLPGSVAGMNIKIFDLDNNGLNDIIMSSEQQTWIYEYGGGGVEEADKWEVRSGKLEIFPNPCYGNLTIKFQILNNKYQMNVKGQNYVQSSKPEGLPYIKIYDASGRLVRQWGHETMRLSDQVVWSGTDEIGRRVPAGIYFVRLAIGPVGESGGEEVIRKAVLLR